jgi:2-polyprenyl-3-methyl-5-hydroxy-6-metoxy-1,4-benzoquinol methylase
MADDPKSLVARGYDILAHAYLERYGRSRIRDRWLGELIARLPAAARILDIGCGAGVPVARELAAHGFDVIGVDGSAVPGADFIRADVTAIDFAASSFDAIAAFYVITHVPREEHASLLRRIAGWLKPDGVFLASLGSADCAAWRGQWLGAEMFFSHYDADTYERLLLDAGLTIERTELADEDVEPERFVWVIARRPRS